MAIKLNKTSKVVVAIGIVLLSGLLGYLVWRVNQPEQLSTTDSEAAATYCVDTELVLQVDKHVCGDGCIDTGECPARQTFTMDVPTGGKYTVKGVVGRGNPGQTQTEEEFYLSINGKKGPTIQDDADPAAITTTFEVLGNFDFIAGSNTIKMISAAPSCPPSDYANSVYLKKICLYEVVECGDGILGSGEQCEVGDPAGSSCTWDNCNQTSCTCKYLTITKSAVKSCLNTDTDSPIAELTYTITMKNADTENNRTITKVKDVLDAKILAAGVIPTSITAPGEYSNGNIVWKYDTENLIIQPGGSKVLTYKVSIDKDHFGEYTNTVTLTRLSGGTSQATATIVADCDLVIPLATCGNGVLDAGESCELGDPDGVSCEWDSCNQTLCVCVTPGEPDPVVPQTGIFDSTLGRIGAGIALLIIGGIVYTIPNGIFIVKKKENTYRYRAGFEKRVANR